MVHFPAGTLHPPQTTAWSWNVVNETWERPPTGDNPGPRLQHNTLDSCSHNNSIPSPFHTTALHQIWDEHNKERYVALWCYWTELWKLAQATHQLTTQASIVSAVTSFGTGHALEGNTEPNHQGFYSKHKGSRPCPCQGCTDQRGDLAQHPVQSLDTVTPITPPIQGDDGQHTLRIDLMCNHTENSPHIKKYWTHRVYTGILPLKKPLQIRSDQISCSVVSDSLRPHESQHTRPPCPSPAPRVYSNSCASSQ